MVQQPSDTMVRSVAHEFVIDAEGRIDSPMHEQGHQAGRRFGWADRRARSPTRHRASVDPGRNSGAFGGDYGQAPMLLHITTPDAWAQAQRTGTYTDPSLDAEGFIHCSTPEQVLIPANERFAGRTDLCLLVIDADALTERLVFEDCYETGMEFPHVYGPINIDAVTATVDFPCSTDGSFALPAHLPE